jgi:hypothetical protein
VERDQQKGWCSRRRILTDSPLLELESCGSRRWVEMGIEISLIPCKRTERSIHSVFRVQMFIQVADHC